MLEQIRTRTQVKAIMSFWYGECAFVGESFSRRNQLRHFCWLLGQDARKGNKYVSRISIPPHRIIALSHSLQSEFVRHYAVRPSHVVPPGINSFVKFQDEVRDIDILGAGSLIPLKQFDLWLQLIKDLKISYPGVRAVLAGEGPERSGLEQFIRANDLQDHVQLTGELSHTEVIKLMKRTKIFLHPSYYEGFSGVCQEALASGAHVVSFCQPMQEEIEHWHVVSSVDAMKMKVSHLLAQPLLDHTPVVPFPLEQSVGGLMKLFS